MHIGKFVRGKGRFVETPFVPTEERTNRRYPLILTTGRILSQYNVGAQTRRTENLGWHPEDLLEIHPYDAEERGVAEAAGWRSRAVRARPNYVPISPIVCPKGLCTRPFTTLRRVSMS